MTQPAPHVQPPTREVRIIRRMLNSEACMWLDDYDTIVVHAGLTPEAQMDAIRQILSVIGQPALATTLALSA